MSEKKNKLALPSGAKECPLICSLIRNDFKHNINIYNISKNERNWTDSSQVET